MCASSQTPTTTSPYLNLLHLVSIMADMDVDTDVPAPSKSKGKSKDDSKDGKKKFEVKKVRTPITIAAVG